MGTSPSKFTHAEEKEKPIIMVLGRQDLSQSISYILPSF